MSKLSASPEISGRDRRSSELEQPERKSILPLNHPSDDSPSPQALYNTLDPEEEQIEQKSKAQLLPKTETDNQQNERAESISPELKIDKYSFSSSKALKSETQKPQQPNEIRAIDFRENSADRFERKRPHPQAPSPTPLEATSSSKLQESAEESPSPTSEKPQKRKASLTPIEASIGERLRSRLAKEAKPKLDRYQSELFPRRQPATKQPKKYMVEKIIKHAFEKKGNKIIRWYLIKWKSGETSWQTSGDIASAALFLLPYWEDFQMRADPASIKEASPEQIQPKKGKKIARKPFKKQANSLAAKKSIIKKAAPSRTPRKCRSQKTK